MGAPRKHKCTFRASGKKKTLGGQTGTCCTFDGCTYYQIGTQVYIVRSNPQTRQPEFHPANK